MGYNWIPLKRYFITDNRMEQIKFCRLWRKGRSFLCWIYSKFLRVGRSLVMKHWWGLDSYWGSGWQSDCGRPFSWRRWFEHDSIQAWKKQPDTQVLNARGAEAVSVGACWSVPLGAQEGAARACGILVQAWERMRHCQLRPDAVLTCTESSRMEAVWRVEVWC